MSREKPGAWPLEHQEFEAWTRSVQWIPAVTRPMNPHEYHLKRRSPSPRTFERMVLHLREFGYQEWFGGAEYSYYEAGGYRYWTMMNPLEWTILVNRKELPETMESENKHDASDEQSNLSETLPELYTSRYLAGDVLSSGLVVPVTISMYAPEPLLGPLRYPLEHEVRDLMPERWMHAKWHKFSTTFWRHLDGIGIEKIAAQLSTISAQHESLPLVLCCCGLSSESLSRRSLTSFGSHLDSERNHCKLCASFRCAPTTGWCTPTTNPSSRWRLLRRLQSACA